MEAAKDRLLASFPARAVKRYLEAQGPNWATLIAWNGLFALFPIVLVIATVIGVVLHSPGIASGVEQQVNHAFPGGHVNEALQAFHDKAGIFGVVGFAGLLWSGSSLFSAIEQALSALYPCKPRDFLPQKLMGFGMILLFTVLAVPLVLSSSLLPALESLPVVPRLLTTGPVAVVLQVAAGALDGSVLFLAIYYVVPHRRQRFRHVLPGAVTAGVLLEGLTLLFPLYFKLAGGFATYGQTFALFFLLLTYFFFLGQITMIGGAVNAEYEVARTPSDCIAPSDQGAMRPSTTVVGRRDPGALPAGPSRERRVDA
jgi:YihY family inner membrane protein